MGLAFVNASLASGIFGAELKETLACFYALHDRTAGRKRKPGKEEKDREEIYASPRLEIRLSRSIL